MRVVIGFIIVAALTTSAVAGCSGDSFEAVPNGQSGAGGSGTGGSGTGGSGTGGSGTGGSGAAGSAAGGSGTGGSSAGRGVGGGAGRGGGSAGAGAGGGQVATGGNSSGTGGVSPAGGPGMAGAGGEPSELCHLPAEQGPCEAAFERWYFNAERGVCQVFTYGGCDGNENNFETLAACHAACADDGLVDVTSCETPMDCVVTPAQCCGGSSTPTIADVTAVARTSAGEFTAPCQLVDCVSTLLPIPAYFGATCSAGHCLAFDVRETELTTCNAPSDCYLRNQLSCCEGCTGEAYDFVALAKGADLSPLVCGDELVGCAACAPIPDPTIAADCVMGRCEVVPAEP
jgi:hypothetical protein